MSLRARVRVGALRAIEAFAEGKCASWLVRRCAASPGPRKLLNAAYLKFGQNERTYFYWLYAKIFRDSPLRGREGHWEVAFAGKALRMPLAAGQFWLDWDTAVSITGHDPEIKQTYEALLRSPLHRPEIFVDIGANYGTHSLLFLAHGVRTLTFEPNSTCHDYFLRACRLNHLAPALEQAALGAAAGHVDLAYPERETWLGSTSADTQQALGRDRALVHETVGQKPLDDYLPALLGRRVLIKIDTEGNELKVLEGAAETLRLARPMLVFESVPGSDRAGLSGFLSARGYSIYELPWLPDGDAGPISVEQFLASASDNFAALPGADRQRGLGNLHSPVRSTRE